MPHSIPTKNKIENLKGLKVHYWMNAVDIIFFLLLVLVSLQDGTAVVVGGKTNRAKGEFLHEINGLLDQVPETIQSSTPTRHLIPVVMASFSICMENITRWDQSNLIRLIVISQEDLLLSQRRVECEEIFWGSNCEELTMADVSFLNIELEISKNPYVSKQ